MWWTSFERGFEEFKNGVERELSSSDSEVQTLFKATTQVELQDDQPDDLRPLELRGVPVLAAIKHMRISSVSLWHSHGLLCTLTASTIT